MEKYVSFCVSVLFYCGNLFAQSAWMEWEEQVGEEENVASWREQYEELSELAEHPLNINTVTKEELEQLPFLSDRLIEHILYYVYKYGPLTSMNELWGVEGMDRQTQAFLREFMYVGPVKKKLFPGVMCGNTTNRKSGCAQTYRLMRRRGMQIYL